MINKTKSIVLFLLITLTTFISTTSTSKLYNVCQKNSHCSTSIPNSFCGWSELNEQQTICMCRDGYKASEDGSACTARHRCDFTGFNAVQKPGFGCPSGRQFCRRSVCLCRYGYKYDHLDHCLPNEDYSLLEELQTNNNTNSIPMKSPPDSFGGIETPSVVDEETLNFGFFLFLGTVFLSIALILTVFSSITAIIFARKFYNLKLQMSYSRTTKEKLLV